MSTPVVECVEDALQAAGLDEATQSIQLIVDERRRLMDAVRHFGFVEHVWPSAANFFLVRVTDSGAVMRHSERERVLLRDFDGSLANCIRITVGDPDENDRLLRTFEQIEASRR